MKIGKTLYVTNGKDWRSWLVKNYKTKTEIWLIYYRKETAKPRIAYNTAVEEALCYGWIDGIIKSVDKERFAQRFSPRRPTSVLSQLNKERIRKLSASKKMTKAGFRAVTHVYNPDEKFIFPPDTLKALKADKQTWENYQSFPESYKRVRVAYIEYARTINKPELNNKQEFQKRLQHFLKMTAQNKKFGFAKEML